MHKKAGSEFMNILIAGKNTVKYLKTVVYYMNADNRMCAMKYRDIRSGIELYEMEIEDPIQGIVKINCYCMELAFQKAFRQLEEHRPLLDECNAIINLIPIKCFSALRYNVDEDWEGIDTWIIPELYQRKLASVVRKKTEIIWVLQGVEGLCATNDFFQRPENVMVLNFPVKEGLQEIVSRFFAEIEEEAFEEAVRDDAVFFGFDLENRQAGRIGENAMKFWILASFGQLFQEIELVLCEEDSD